MDQTFIDPVVHSRRVMRVQIAVFAVLLAAVAAGVWIKWLAAGSDPERVRFPLMMSSAVAAGFFAGYYMMQRNRRLLMAGARLLVSDAGLRWETPGGWIEVAWPEVTELRISSRPSRSRRPDVTVLTGRGSLGAFMRWTDAAGPLPEPVLWSGGMRFRMPDGAIVALSPERSALVAALTARVPEEKIKRGVIVSI